MQQILQTQAFFVFAVLTKPKTQSEITGMTLITGTTKNMHFLHHLHENSLFVHFQFV